MSANLATVQEQIQQMRDGKVPSQKDIFDAQAFIATERRDRPKTNASLESFFQEWEGLISQKKALLDEKSREVVEQTGARLDAEKTQVSTNTPSLESVKTDIEREISGADIERMSKTLSTTESILATFEKLNPSQREAARGFLGLALITRLNRAGYQVTIQSNKIEVKPLPGTKANQAQAVQLETFLGTNPRMQENLTYGLIYGSSEFRNYATVYAGSPTNQMRNYLDYLSDTKKGQSQNQLSLADQSLFASRSSIESVLRNPNTVNGLILGAPQVQVAMQTLANNPAQAQRAAQALGQAAATPANSGNRAAPNSPANAPANSNNMVSKILGKAGIAVEGGFSDIMNTPGAPLAIMIAFLATWVFGDFKKALGVVLGAFGISSVANAIEANKGGSTPSKNPVKAGGQKGQKNIPKTAPKMDHTIDISKRPSEEQKMWNRVKTTPQLLKDLDTRGEKLSDYMNFIYTNNLLSKNISEIVLTTDPKDSIFTDNAVPPNNFPDFGKLSMLEIKRILRLLLGQDYRYASSDPDGNTAKANFIPSKLLKDQNDQKISEADWKNKKLSEASALISKQF